MCRSSAGPLSGGTGTTGTPARSAATIATTVGSVGVACTATIRAPVNRPASASAAAPSRSQEVTWSPTRTASG